MITETSVSDSDSIAMVMEMDLTDMDMFSTDCEMDLTDLKVKSPSGSVCSSNSKKPSKKNVFYETISMDVTSSTSLLDLMQRFHKTYNISLEKQRWKFNKIRLKDEMKTMGELGLNPSKILDVFYFEK
jgi:hypothetical protein